MESPTTCRQGKLKENKTTEMIDDRLIAAIEISSSKIIAAVGRSSGEGRMEVLAVEQEKAVDAVRYGIIQNVEETSVRVRRLLERIERRQSVAPAKVAGMVCGLSGRSLRNITSEVKLNLPDETEITDEILLRLRNDAMRAAIDSSLEVVDAVPRFYKVGNAETHSPKGRIGNHIEATYDLIVCRPELKRNMTRVVCDKLGKRVEGFVVTPLAAGHLILTPDEKRLGCMFVDMGAETTTVSIYRNASLIYLATLPLGGRNITRDIISLNVLEESAEDIKVTSGNAMPRQSVSTLNLNGVKLSDVSHLVVERSGEIVANIIEQMAYAGLKETDLPGGIVVIGGGMRLQGITDLLAEQSNLPVRRGKLPAYVSVEETNATSLEAEEVVSVLYAGATLANCNCFEQPQINELPPIGDELPEIGESEEREEPKRKPKKESRFMRGLKDRVSNLFSGPVDNSELID